MILNGDGLYLTWRLYFQRLGERSLWLGAGGAWGELKDINGEPGYEYDEQQAFSRIITARISLESHKQEE